MKWLLRSPPIGGGGGGGIALAFQVVLVLGCCPFPMFLGEVLSDFHFSMLPSTSCNVLHCLLGFALLE